MFGQRDFGRYFVNSLVVACSVVIVSALIAFLAATAVTRFRFRFRTLTVPLFLRLRDFALLNTRGSLILPRIAFSPPFAIWMPRGSGRPYRRLWRRPRTSTARAARDSCGRFFISARNDFLFAKSFIISDTSRSTPPMALLVLLTPVEPDRGGVMAASTVTTIAVPVFFVLVQRRLVSAPGGAVKD